MTEKGSFSDLPLGMEDTLPSGRHQGTKVVKVLANDPVYILDAIRKKTFDFTPQVKHFAKEAV